MRRMPMALGIHPRIWSVFLFFVLAGTLLIPGFASAEGTPAGKWIAEVSNPRGELVFLVNIELTDEGWRGDFTPPRGGVQPFESVTIDGENVVFKLSGSEGKIPVFTGVFKDEFERLVGKLVIPGFPTADLKFRRFRELALVDGHKRYPASGGPSGIWLGKVKGPNDEEFTVTLVLDKAEGNWQASISDPDMSETAAENLTVDSDTRISFTFRPESAPFPSSFAGSYIAARDRINGTVSMRGNSRFIRFKRQPGSYYIQSINAGGEPEEPMPVRHPYRFSVAARAGYWSALHLVEDNTYNINAITAGATGIDGALRYHLMDPFTVFVRGYRGGQNFTDRTAKLEPFEDLGLNSDSYLKLDGFEFGMIGYLGNVMMRDSKFNPYLTAAFGSVNWELTQAGRGSELLIDNDKYLNGNDLSVAVGVGTEYKLKPNLNLEFELLWRHFATGDDTKWKDKTGFWNNTHSWVLSCGVTYAFWQFD